MKRLKTKFVKNENAAAKNSDSRYEICVICHKVTPVLKEQPIEFREYYVCGCGQLCYECYHSIHSEIHIWDKPSTE